MCGACAALLDAMTHVVVSIYLVRLSSSLLCFNLYIPHYGANSLSHVLPLLLLTQHLHSCAEGREFPNNVNIS